MYIVLLFYLFRYNFCCFVVFDNNVSGIKCNTQNKWTASQNK